jgi:hypothetical protein
VLWSKWAYLGKRNNPEPNILLYQIEGFYVEVFYHRQDNALKRLHSFFSTGQLLPYLDKIDIGSLR